MRIIIIIFMLSLLHGCQKKHPELPRFIVYGNTFIYQNHPRSEPVYIELWKDTSY